MKKIILIGCLFSCFILACKKEKANKTDDTKKYNLALNVSGFTQTILTSKSQINSVEKKSLKSDALSDVLSILYYQVYDSGNHLILSQTQTKTDAGFGMANFSLANGKYTIAVMGSKIDPFSGENLMNVNSRYFYFNPYSNVSNYVNSWIPESFFKKITVTVAGGAASQNIALERVNGQLEINVDNIVRYASNGVYDIENESRFYSISANAAVDSANTHIVHSFNNSTVDTDGWPPQPTTYLTNILNTSTPIKVTIQLGYDVVFQKSIMVKCKKNTKTVLTATGHYNTGNGNLFDITFNTSYSTDTLRTDF